jgi:microcystin-dependent protein
MNRKITFLALMLCLFGIRYRAYAQAPQLFNYQAVARNGSSILSNQSINLQFTIHDQTTNGTTLYEETQVATTNTYGIFTAKIGGGIVEAGTFSAVDWSSGPKYLEVDIDETGGSNFVTMGTTQLISVPYALNAGNGVPPGTIIAFGGANVPAGWLFCDGSTESVTAYPALYSAIGTAWGNANNNSQQFNVPDLRGEFLRGVNGTTANNVGVIAANDPDASSRITLTGGNVGNNVGSLQSDTLKSHHHTLTFYNGPAGVTNIDNPNSNGDAANYNTSDFGGLETRPKNAYVNYIIKY